MRPLTLGIREAKARLSSLLKAVQRGKEIVITERGKPVGKIVPLPPDEMPLAQRIALLEREGLIGPKRASEKKKLPPPIPLPEGLAQRFLQEDRRS